MPSVSRTRQERALGAQPMLKDSPSLLCLCSSSWGGLCSAREGSIAECGLLCCSAPALRCPAVGTSLVKSL